MYSVHPSINGFRRNRKIFLRCAFLMVTSAGDSEGTTQIGEELLKPELLLTLRLVGLRVTKLTDLRADAESKACEIKRVGV